MDYPSPNSCNHDQQTRRKAVTITFSPPGKGWRAGRTVPGLSGVPKHAGACAGKQKKCFATKKGPDRSVGPRRRAAHRHLVLSS